MTKRHNALIELKLSIWKKVGSHYTVDPKDLLAAIRLGGTTEDERQRRMGFGYKHIQELLNGGKVDIWEASFVENGIIRHREVYNGPTGY